MLPSRHLGRQRSRPARVHEPARTVPRRARGRAQVAVLDGERRWVRALDGTEYMPGLVGLNNMKANDYINVVVQARPAPALLKPNSSSLLLVEAPSVSYKALCLKTTDAAAWAGCALVGAPTTAPVRYGAAVGAGEAAPRRAGVRLRRRSMLARMSCAPNVVATLSPVGTGFRSIAASGCLPTPACRPFGVGGGCCSSSVLPQVDVILCMSWLTATNPDMDGKARICKVHTAMGGCGAHAEF
jgi:hypothetical protein